MTTERSEATRCAHCRCKLDDLAHSFGEEVLCDDCFDAACDAEEEQSE